MTERRVEISEDFFMRNKNPPTFDGGFLFRCATKYYVVAVTSDDKTKVERA